MFKDQTFLEMVNGNSKIKFRGFRSNEIPIIL